MGIYAKLNKVQVALNAPKNQYNSFGKYNYRSCEDILEGLKPLLKEVGAVVVLSDEVVEVGERIEGISNLFVKSTAVFADTESDEKIEVSAYARHEDNKKGMDDAQVTGATSSYARKYALNGLFCIDDNKDADTDAYANMNKKDNKPTNTVKQKPKSAPSVPEKTGKKPAKSHEEIMAKIEELEIPLDKVATKFGKSVEELTDKDLMKAIHLTLEKRKNNAQ